MNINLRIEQETETASQLTDQIRNLNRRLTIDLNSRIIFLRVLLVVRKRRTTSIQVQGITTIQEQINGAVNRTWLIRDKIHRK